MADQLRKLPPVTERLNATELSQHIKMLMDRESVSPTDDLLMLALVFWATENLPLEHNWAEKMVGELSVWATEDEEGAYNALAEAWGLLETETLEEAGMALMRTVADMVFPD